MAYTLVAVHAHPDDEALLTGGTLARAAAEGHRVVLAMATDGARGTTSTDIGRRGPLAARRRKELASSAAALGVSRVVWLGYDDSGDSPGGLPADGHPLAGADIAEVAARIADTLSEERADVVLGYDPAGGYGHRDHVAVHHAVRGAAALAQTPVLLEATVDRDALIRAATWLRRLPGLPGTFEPDPFRAAYTPRGELTHRVDVRRYLRQKRAALASHLSQSAGDGDLRTVALLLRLPTPVFTRVLGREWYVEVGRPAGRCDDVFDSLRQRPRGC